jgi:bla regulator protein blaR1
MIPESLSPIANHLWQSTLFACAAWLLTLALRKNPARVRHWIWVTATLKFLVPFSLLIALGSHVPWRAAQAPAAASVSIALDQVSQPFAPGADSSPVVMTAAARTSIVPAIVWTLWACGFLGVAVSWLIRWRRINAAVRAGSPVSMDMVNLGIPMGAISSPAFIEPGIFGVFRPILLLPEGITERLTPEQWNAIVAHELCHVRRRDNLIGVIQMFIETVFWFHPLVWWIGKRIFEERERACDEEVLKLGNEPRVYARGILTVCELYLESPMPCVAGVSGSNLRMRIEAILNGSIVKNLNGGTKALLAGLGLIAVAAPIVIGLLDGVTLRAQTVSPDLRFEVASVKTWVPDPKTGGRHLSGVPGPTNTDPGRFSARIDVMSLVLTAYDIPLYRLSEQLDIYNQRVEIEAKMPVDTTREQFNVMLQNLLADRLGLKVHWATKDIDMYAMVVAKGGSKLKPAAPDPPPGSNDDSKKAGPLPNRVGDDGFPIPPPGNADWMGGAPGGKMGLRGHNQTAEEMAHYIGMRTLDGPVADTTGLAGLTGKYDYTIFWSTPATSAALRAAPTADEPEGPSIFDAVQEQLGLKIEKRKSPAQVLVVDHVEKKPTEN